MKKGIKNYLIILIIGITIGVIASRITFANYENKNIQQSKQTKTTNQESKEKMKKDESEIKDNNKSKDSQSKQEGQNSKYKVEKSGFELVINGKKTDIELLNINDYTYIKLADLAYNTNVDVQMNGPDTYDGKYYIYLSDSTKIIMKKIDGKDYVDITHFVHRYDEILSKDEIGFYGRELPYSISKFTLQRNPEEPRRFRLDSIEKGFSFEVESYWQYDWYVDLETFREEFYPIMLNMVIENEKFYSKHPNSKIKLESEKNFFKEWEDFYSELEDAKK